MLLKMQLHKFVRVLCVQLAFVRPLSWLLSPFPLSILVMGLLLIQHPALGQRADAPLPAQELKKMSMEELMNLEVTTVSRHPEKLTEVASAVQVITREDIRRSAATNLPEALRLATNLQVAQLNSFASIISARGFNALYSNKLLVMIDGRTVYSPLFAGVFWDAQQVLLEDIERIEVISGPGGSLWEANAVNGIINIITKSSNDTQGLYVSGAAGNLLKNQAVVRYGGKIGTDLAYRIYAQHTARGHTYLPDGTESPDNWGMTNGGFQLDWTPSEKSNMMVQGSVYEGKEQTLPVPTTLDGQNILGRWRYTFSEKQETVAQVYFDRSWRRMPTIAFELNVYDVDLQHRVLVGERHNILVGAGYRFMNDHTHNYTEFSGILPNKRDMNLFNSFIQDDIQLIPEKLRLTLGTKLLHNEFTDFELQPGMRLAWNSRETQTVWGAISRAVRTPSRIDVDYFIPTYQVPAENPSVAGGPNFISEKVVAYELGYRLQPASNLSLSLAAFYNRYDDLYSVDALPGTQTYQIQNGTEGQTWGAEFFGTWQVFKDWRLRGGYNYFNKNLQNKPGSVYNYAVLGYDAKNQVLLQSIANLPGNLQFDIVSRYLGELPGMAPEYFTFDARLAWVFKQLELSVAGQNLWNERHVEWGTEIPRSIYGKVTCRF